MRQSKAQAFLLFLEAREMIYHTTSYNGLHGIMSRDRLTARPDTIGVKSFKKIDDTEPGSVSLSRTKDFWYPGKGSVNHDTREITPANSFRLILDKESMRKENKSTPFSHKFLRPDEKEREERVPHHVENVRKHLRGVEFDTSKYTPEQSSSLTDRIKRELNVPVYTMTSKKMTKDRYQFHKGLENPPESPSRGRRQADESPETQKSFASTLLSKFRR